MRQIVRSYFCDKHHYEISRDLLSIKTKVVNVSSISCSLTSVQTVCFEFSHCCARVIDRDLDSGCLVCNNSRKRPDLSSILIQMIVSSIHNSGARGWMMTHVGTAHVSATSGTSYRVAVSSEVSTDIYMVVEIRDGDKSKLRNKDILKFVIIIIDIIASKLLGMDVWEQIEIDRQLSEILHGSKNEWCWFRANFSVNVSLVISTTVCRADAAKSDVQRSFSARTSRNSQISSWCQCFVWTKSLKEVMQIYNSLTRLEFLIMSTGVDSFTDDMITDTEVYHTFKLDHEEHVRRGTYNVDDETDFTPSVQLKNETLDFITNALEMDQNILSRHEWRVVSWTRSVFCSCRFSKVFNPTLYWILLWRKTSDQRILDFLQNLMMMTRFLMNEDKISVRTDLFDEKSVFLCQLWRQRVQFHQDFKRLWYSSLILRSRSKAVTSLLTGVLIRSCSWRMMLSLGRWNSTRRIDCKTVNQLEPLND